MNYFKKLELFIKNILICSFFLIAMNLCMSDLLYASINNPFDILQKNLIKDGFNNARINSLYSSPEAYFNAREVAKYFLHNESTLNYDQFTSKESIEKARIYIKTYRKDLKNAEKKYGVDKKIITAILLIETRLGQYTGKQKVFNTLSSISALMGEKARMEVWQSIPPFTISEEFFKAKANKKSVWAYRELKAFLRYTQEQNINPLCIKGSYAGAIGIAQFMPSNLFLLAEDGNNNGKIDLFEHSDAICSVANYLKYYGWYTDINTLEATKILRHYNNSSQYINTVIKIVKLL